MEILNNIWVALSTPNTELLNILLIPAGIIENILTMNIFISLFDLITNTKQKIIYVALMTIVGILNLLFLHSPFNILFNYLCMIIFIRIIFKASFLKSFLSTLVSASIFALAGTLIANPFFTLLNISSDLLNSVPIYRLAYLSLVYTILLIVIFILKNKNLKIKFFLEEIDKKNKLIMLFNIILGLFALAIQLIITIYYTDTFSVLITFLSFISLLIYFSISIYSLTRIIKLSLTSRRLESAEEYNNTLRILHDNVRGFKHDFDNIVTTIGGYIRTDDIEGLKQYYLQLEDDCQRVNNMYVLNPEIVNNDGIYNLIMKKYHEAEEKDIKVNISFMLDLSTLKMKVYEFARILGIFLDNAIEASSDCDEKIINLTFRNDSKNSRQLITIENTYANKDVDTQKIFEKGISGKENHCGLGLWEVNKLLNKNKNLSLFTTKNEKYFSQQLEIYYN